MTALIALVALGAGSLPLQGSAVEGVIRSSDGDRPLAYAQVQIIGDSISDWTDREGTYRLEGLAEGQWEVRVLHPGHDTLQLAVFVPGDRPVRLDVTLSARPGPGEEALADFEPFRVEFTLPALLNGPAISELLTRLYPPELASARIGGEAVLLLWLDERGRVARSDLSASSGRRALDSIALAVSDSMRFRPARSRQDPVRVIVRVPVQFSVPDPDADGEEAPRVEVGATGSRPRGRF